MSGSVLTKAIQVISEWLRIIIHDQSDPRVKIRKLIDDLEQILAEE